MTQTFVESCVDFEVAYLSTLMVRRLPYSEIPTLIGAYSSDEQIYIRIILIYYSHKSSDYIIMLGTKRLLRH